MAELLNDKNKKMLEKQAIKITNEDISEVKRKLPDEFIQIEKLLKEHPDNSTLKSVIETGSLFYDILNNEEFRLRSGSAKWIGFALKYLISPYDLIPDKIGTLGYYDDNLVLLWVKYMLEDEIKRYKSFCLAKKHLEEGELFEKVSEEGDKVFILVPGLFTRLEADELQINWTEQIKNFYPGSTIYIYRWVNTELKELQTVCQTLNHEIQLKALYDLEKLETDWNDALVHAELYAKSLKRCIENDPALKGKEISLAGHSMGCHLISEFLPLAESNIQSIVFLAAATTARNNILDSSTKFNKLINVYSEKDNVLKFIFDKFSTDHKPLGLAPLLETRMKKIHDVDKTKLIAKHSDYSQNLAKILNELTELI